MRDSSLLYDEHKSVLDVLDLFDRDLQQHEIRTFNSDVFRDLRELREL